MQGRESGGRSLINANNMFSARERREPSVDAYKRCVHYNQDDSPGD